MKSADEFLWDVKLWWRCAGESVRKQFVEELMSESQVQVSPSSSNLKTPDMTYMVSFENDWHRLGDRFVYVYTTDANVPFYVGMGDKYRPTNLASRSENFQSEFVKHPYCKVYIIAANVLKKYAGEIETLCIRWLLDQGWPLTNVLKTTVSDDSYQELLYNYPNVVETLEKFHSSCLQKMVDETPNAFENVIMKPDELRRSNPSQNLWKINGVIKPSSEWCKEYNQQVSTALRRIMQDGCTPYEALTFPKMKNKTYKTRKEYWKSLGLIPGSDTTSQVISICYAGTRFVDVDALLRE